MAPVGDDSDDIERTEEPAGSAVLQISNAIGRIHKQLVGRGPDGVRTYIADDLVVCLLHGGFTHVEQTAREYGGELAVVLMRMHLEEAMRPAIVEAVQAVTGRRVRSFMSANHPADNVQGVIMVLDVKAPPTIET